MLNINRRSVLAGSLGLAATGALSRPYIANAAATTATVWQVQGFFPEEDAAFKKVVADYEKASGNKIDYSIMPFMALNQKTVSALTSGDAPDLIFHDAPETLLPQNAWNDADDNNGYHEKLFLMDFDGTLSTELAVINKDKKAYLEQMVVKELPNGNDGAPMPAVVGAGGGFIPKGAKNAATAKDYMKYFMQPEVMNENLKNGLGRWVPAIPELVKSDPFWLDPKDPHRATYVTEAVLGPTIPSYNGYNPAYGQVQAEQVWGTCHADVIKSGMTPAAAVDKAFKRAEAIFTKYTF